MKKAITPPIKSRMICYIEDEVETFCSKYGSYFKDDQAKDVIAEQIIIAIIKDIVFNRCKYSKDKFELADTIWYYLNKTFGEDMLEVIINNMIVDLVTVRTMVIQFVGTDGWIMHFVKEGANQFVVEKSIDYRIYDWSVQNKTAL